MSQQPRHILPLPGLRRRGCARHGDVRRVTRASEWDNSGIPRGRAPGAAAAWRLPLASASGALSGGGNLHVHKPGHAALGGDGAGASAAAVPAGAPCLRLELFFSSFTGAAIKQRSPSHGKRPPARVGQARAPRPLPARGRGRSPPCPRPPASPPGLFLLFMSAGPR